MHAILGIDAAWTPVQPSGVALVEGAPGAWRAVCAAPSYDAFVARSRGEVFDWRQPRFAGSWPELDALLAAARRMTAAELTVVAVDMPIAKVPFDCRRAADSAISKAFAGRKCSTHSPTALRPGPVGRSLMEQLESRGFPLATAPGAPHGAPCTIEVYPHTALLSLLRLDERLEYKVFRSGKYWPGRSRRERIGRLLEHFALIDEALSKAIAAAHVPLPHAGDVPTLAALKKIEDVLDALVCAWVGTRFVAGEARPYGDDVAAIWVPD